MINTLCSICGRSELKRYSDGSSILFCEFCGHGRTNIQQKFEYFELEGAIHRFGFLGELIIRILNYSRCISILGRVKKKRGNFLDCGCGRGEIVNFFNKLGWKAYGTELNDRTAIDARNRNLSIIISEEFTNFVKKNSGTFDLITTFHNLEHIDNPDLFILNCKNLLNVNGKLFIEVPNFTALQSIFARENWLLLDTKNHVNHFTKKSLSIMLTKYDLKFRFLSTWSLKFGPIGMLFAILSKNNKLNKTFKFEHLTGTQLKFSFLTVCILAALLMPIGFFLEVCAILIGRGSVLRVIVYK